MLTNLREDTWRKSEIAHIKRQIFLSPKLTLLTYNLILILKYQETDKISTIKMKI